MEKAEENKMQRNDTSFYFYISEGAAVHFVLLLLFYRDESMFKSMLIHSNPQNHPITDQTCCFCFPSAGVERCPAGWPIRGQEPDAEANQGARKKPALI